MQLEDNEKQDLLDYLAEAIDCGFSRDPYGRKPLDAFEECLWSDDCVGYEHEGDLWSALELFFDDIRVGSSKLVLVSDKIPDYVYKIPLRGSYGYEKLVGEDGYLYDSNDLSYYEFKQAGSKLQFPAAKGVFGLTSTSDYCAVEARVTEYVERFYPADVELAIAPTFFIGEIAPGFPVYVSERVDMADGCDGAKCLSDFSATFSDSRKIAGKIKCAALDDDLIACFVDCYGEKLAKAMIDFVNDTNIHDLYWANVGFDEDGRIRIVDYSGYDD